MAKKKRTLTWLIIALSIIVITIVIAISALAKKQYSSTAINVYIEEVKKRTIKQTVSASGKVFPETEINVSSDVSGELVELFVLEGDSVTKGQVLAKIDPDLYKSAVKRGEASLNNSKAQVASAKANQASAAASLQQSIAQKKQIEAQLENARTVFNRNKKLLADGVISQLDYDNALSSLRSLEANLDGAKATILSSQASIESAHQSVKSAEFTVQSAEASLNETKTNLNRTSISATMSGIISYLGKEKGETVLGTNQMQGDIIFKISNLSNMEIQVDVSESDVLRVQKGNNVDIEVDAYLDRIFTGKVTEIANSANNTTGTNLTTDQVTNFTVKIRIDRASYNDLVSNKNRFAFRPGMSASVDINTKKIENVLSVPIQAVTTRKQKTQDDKEEDLQEVVFINSTDTSSLQIVKTGIQDNKHIQILSGLSEGDQIITGPYAAVSKKLQNGEKVKIIKKK